MMRQHLAIKREVPEGAIVMFRLGDFYEMFGEDAVVAAPILGATLTKRGNQPMCGVPHHALNAYLAKLIRAGKTAALCEQVEDPKTAKGDWIKINNQNRNFTLFYKVQNIFNNFKIKSRIYKVFLNLQNLIINKI